MKHILIGASMALALGGCYSERASVNDVAPREASIIQYSLFKEDRDVVGDDVVNRALDGKIEMVKHGKMAVVQIGKCYFSDLGNSEKHLEIIRNGLTGNEFIGDVVKVPNLLMPDKVTVPVMRGIVSRLQCQLLMLYNVELKSDYRARMFNKNKIKVVMTVEGLVVHVKTGIIPVTVVVDKVIEIEEKEDDANRYESVQRAHREALELALGEMAIKVRGMLR